MAAKSNKPKSQKVQLGSPFAAAWPDRHIVQEVLAQITWYHNIALLEKLSDPGTRLDETLPEELQGSLPAVEQLETEQRMLEKSDGG